MQPVKQDLVDLSNKLLLSSKYDQSYQAKLGFLEAIFPKGPALVVVYIDDLDRCFSNRVVAVLEVI